MPIAALLSAETVRMPRERSSSDAPSSSFVPWALRLGLLLVQHLLLGVELREAVDDLLRHRRAGLLRLRLGAVELLACLVELRSARPAAEPCRRSSCARPVSTCCCCAASWPAVWKGSVTARTPSTEPAPLSAALIAAFAGPR